MTVMLRIFSMILVALALVTLGGCAGKQIVAERVAPVFYPPLPQQPRIQYLMSISTENDIKEPPSAFERFVAGDIPPARDLGKPYDIGSLPGTIYVLDRTYKKLLAIDLVKRGFAAVDDSGMGALADPSGIWISADGSKYVADMQRKQVVVFDSNNTFLRSYGSGKVFGKPVDVAAWGDRIFVCDLDGNKVVVFDKESGEVVESFGSLTGQEQSLYKPTHITVDEQGNIFVNDAFNYQIQQFDRDGNHIRSYGFHGDVVGAFARPKGIDTDRQGRLYAVDSAIENVQIFDEQSGRLLLFFGGGGTEPGQMYLPAGIHIDYANAPYFAEYADPNFQLEYVIYVGNMFGAKKLNVYGFGHWQGPALTVR